MKEMGFNMVRKHIKIEVGITIDEKIADCYLRELGGQMVLLGR